MRKTIACVLVFVLLFTVSGAVYAAEITPTVYTYDLKFNATSPFGQITAMGLLTHEGVTPVTEYGFYWSASRTSHPEAGHKQLIGRSVDKLSVDYNWEFLPYNYPELSSPDGFTVYITAYAVNANGTTYGETKSISGTAQPGVFISLEPAAFDPDTAYDAVTLNGHLDSGGKTVLEKGFVYSGEYGDPTVKNGTVLRQSDVSDGDFSVTISNLGPERSYFIRSYVKYGQGSTDYVYSQSRYFTTARYPSEKFEPYMTGADAYHFSPDNNGTYIEVATMLYNLLAYPEHVYESPYRFKDVDYSNPHTANVVNFVSFMGYMTGSDTGYFMNYAPITRASVAVIVSQVLKLGLYYDGPLPIPSVFSDTDGHWSAGYVNLAVRKGIFNGYMENGEVLFKPENYVTKAELAAIFCQMFERDGEPMGSEDFLDVPPSHWAYRYIMNAAVAGN